MGKLETRFGASLDLPFHDERTEITFGMGGIHETVTIECPTLDMLAEHLRKLKSEINDAVNQVEQKIIERALNEN